MNAPTICPSGKEVVASNVTYRPTKHTVTMTRRNLLKSKYYYIHNDIYW